MIEVVNVRNTDDTYEYVGRTRKFGDGSLGNPYELKDYNNDREKVIALFRESLWEQMKDRNSQQYIELQKLKQKALKGDLKLGCHCHPKKCHADVIKRAIEWMMSNDSN